MEIIKTIMIGLGISTTLWLVVKGAKYLMFLIDTAFRSLSRSEWPDESLIPLRWVLNEFKYLHRISVSYFPALLALRTSKKCMFRQSEMHRYAVR